FVSSNGGTTWALNCIVPRSTAPLGTYDITVRFADTTNNLYAGILWSPYRLNILRTNNFMGPTAMTVLVDRKTVDQPYIQATTVGVNDRVYVGDNKCCPPDPGVSGRTATIDQSLDAAATAPVFNAISIESRGTSLAGQDGPAIRPAVHADGTIYGIFYHWTNYVSTSTNSGTVTTDVVVVRDDNGGTGS